MHNFIRPSLIILLLNLSRSLELEEEKCLFHEAVWRAEYLQDDTFKHLVAQVCIDIVAACRRLV